MFRELVRRNNQLSMEECVHVLKTETRGVLSVLGDEGYPYGTPMNHWYHEEDGCVYFHCGKGSSHRLEALQKYDKVSFCVYGQDYKENGHWAWKVKSVIIFGRMEIIDDRAMEVKAKLQEAGFTVLEDNFDQGWFSFLCK